MPAKQKKCCFLVSLKLGVIIGAIVSIALACYCLTEFPGQVQGSYKFSVEMAIFYGYFIFTAVLVIISSLGVIYGAFKGSSGWMTPAALIAIKMYIVAIIFVFYIFESKAMKFKILYDEGKLIEGKMDVSTYVGLHYLVFKAKLIMIIKILLAGAIDCYFRIVPILYLAVEIDEDKELADYEAGKLAEETDKNGNVTTDTEKVDTVTIETEKSALTPQESTKPEMTKPESAKIEPSKELTKL